MELSVAFRSSIDRHRYLAFRLAGLVLIAEEIISRLRFFCLRSFRKHGDWKALTEVKLQES